LIAVILLLNIAILLVALVPQNESAPWDDGGQGRVIVAIASGIAFFLALMHLLLRLDTRAAEYADAANQCAGYKLKHRNQAGGPELEHDYRVLQASLPRIPERQFARTKIRHTRKISVSKLIDERPGVPHWIAWMIVVWRAVRGDRHK
jgi:hypothetical protein